MLCWWWNKIISVGNIIFTAFSTGRLVSFLAVCSSFQICSVKERIAQMTSHFLHAHLFRFRYAVPIFPSGAIHQSVFPGTLTVLLSDLLSIGKAVIGAHLVRECQEEMGRAVHCGACVAETSASTIALYIRTGQWATPRCWELVL